MCGRVQKVCASSRSGRVFLPPDGREIRRIALLLSGTAESEANWRSGRGRSLDLFDLKGALEALGLGELRMERAENANFALGTEIFSGAKRLGWAGQLSSAHATKAGATSPVFLAELDLPNELETALRPRRFQELQRFPAVMRDIALLAPEALSHAEILAAITDAQEPLLGEVALFDLFSGKAAEHLGAGRKSLAYTLTYRDKNRTLTHDEVNAAHDRIRERLKSELGVELRE